ncbi:MAG: TetR/AcrR family transcriptional regulator [Solirubrobacterales bacterium]
MSEGLKTRRPYNSPRRREQAAATRRTILEAAHRLFERHGYAATSMAAIATEAGVALKTVYLAFETKSGLLRALWHLLLRGDQAPEPVGERRWYREVIEEPDAERQLRLNARNSRRVKERAGALLEVIRDAAPADPDIGALWKRIEEEFFENQRSIVESLNQKSALAEGLDVDRAADVLWTLNHPSVYWLLVGERGWTPTQYERWLDDALCWQLLSPRRPGAA